MGLFSGFPDAKTLDRPEPLQEVLRMDKDDCLTCRLTGTQRLHSLKVPLLTLYRICRVRRFRRVQLLLWAASVAASKGEDFEQQKHAWVQGSTKGYHWHISNTCPDGPLEIDQLEGKLQLGLDIDAGMWRIILVSLIWDFYEEKNTRACWMRRLHSMEDRLPHYSQDEHLT